MPLNRYQTKQIFKQLYCCYITYAMDFRFVPSDPVDFDKLSRCDEWPGQHDQGTRVQQVCNRKETTWWEPRGQI